MLINIQIYKGNIHSVLKKKLFLRHNFEKKKNGKEKSSACR
jgi:stalled ribosome alternative rescue factor ArfA